MSWANLDDRLHAHPKVRRLQRMPYVGAEAFGIWCWCLSWCRAFQPHTGRVSVVDVAADWGADPAHMHDVFAALFEVRLVDRREDGDGQFDPDAYYIHDWSDWQLSPQQRGGLHAAASASREQGRFSAGDRLSPGANGLPPAGVQPVTPRPPAGDRLDRTSPRLSSPRLSEPVETVEEIRRRETEAGFRPVPKPTKAKR